MREVIVLNANNCAKKEYLIAIYAVARLHLNMLKLEHINKLETLIAILRDGKQKVGEGIHE